MGFVPLVASKGIAFPANISLDLTPKRIWNPTTRPLHGSEGGRMEKFNMGYRVQHGSLKVSSKRQTKVPTGVLCRYNLFSKNVAAVQSGWIYKGLHQLIF